MVDSDLRVLIVAGDPLARAGLAALLDREETLRTVAQVGLDSTLPDALEVYLPDVMLVDLAWEPAVGLDLLAGLQPLQLPTLALLPDEAAAAEAAALGITGLLPRDSTPAQIVAALAAIGEGLVVSDPQLFAAIAPRPEPPPSPPAEALTPREREVLQLLARGLPNKAIARQLGISDHTVKFHVNSIMGKLQAQSRTEAVVRATRLGLILL
ncbi:MAG: response regulator transcription factor [Anaerolineae bacterium]